VGLPAAAVGHRDRAQFPAPFPDISTIR
jgi:hypothetical protein